MNAAQLARQYEASLLDGGSGNYPRTPNMSPNVCARCLTLELSLRQPDRRDSICQGNCNATPIQVFDPALCRDSVNWL
jgi:hypothetical protein